MEKLGILVKFTRRRYFIFLLELLLDLSNKNTDPKIPGDEIPRCLSRQHIHSFTLQLFQFLFKAVGFILLSLRWMSCRKAVKFSNASHMGACVGNVFTWTWFNQCLTAVALLTPAETSYLWWGSRESPVSNSFSSSTLEPHLKLKTIFSWFVTY